MDELERALVSAGNLRLTAAAVQKALRLQADRTRASGVARFFKTGPGEYGEGDRFVGVTVPVQRRIARRFRELPLRETDSLLRSPVHEDRLTALLILVDQFTRVGDPRHRDRIFRLYMKRLRFINNWDLVDTSAAPIVGGWLAGRPGAGRTRRPTKPARRPALARKTLAQQPMPRQPLAQQLIAEQTREDDLLARLAGSKSVWSRRLSMIATLHDTTRGDHRAAIRVASLLVDDPHDLVQKAVGWMLREVGKRASADALRGFLARHAATMPRTTLRYAIEHLPPAERRRWMRAHLA